MHHSRENFPQNLRRGFFLQIELFSSDRKEVGLAYDGSLASHPNAKYNATLRRTAATRIIGAKTMYARFSCSADQFSRMMKYERIVSTPKKITPPSLSQ